MITVLIIMLKLRVLVFLVVVSCCTVASISHASCGLERFFDNNMEVHDRFTLCSRTTHAS